jgi:hypothetical protein
MIELIAENDMARYFAIGKKITVSERVSGGWLCHTCTSQDRYELGEHKGCSHIQRVKKWAADHPVERPQRDRPTLRAAPRTNSSAIGIAGKVNVTASRGNFTLR